MGVVRPAAGAGDGAEAGTRVAKRWGGAGAAAGAGAPGPAGGVFRLRVSAAGGCGDGGGDVGGANGTIILPMVQLGVPPLGGQGAWSGDTDVGAGGVEDAVEGGAGQPGAGLLGRPRC